MRSTMGGLAIFAILAAGGCSTAAPEEKIRVDRAPIVDGFTTTSTPAVVGLIDEAGLIHCTGTLVSSRAVLTAAHCLERGSSEARIGALIGNAGDPGALVLPIAVSIRHPDYESDTLKADIGVAVLAQPVPASIAPVALKAVSLPPTFAGQTVTLIGYGLDGPGGTFARRGGRARVTALDAATFRTSLAPSQSCGGDSGGPALADAESEPILLGVVSSGDGACASHTTFTRLDVFLTSFVEPTLAAIEDGASHLGERCYHDASCARDATSSRCYAPNEPEHAYCTLSCDDDRGCPPPMRCGGTGRVRMCIYDRTPGESSAAVAGAGCAVGRSSNRMLGMGLVLTLALTMACSRRRRYLRAALGKDV